MHMLIHVSSYIQATAMIDEAQSWNEDDDFRKRVEDKRKEELEEAKKLQEAKEIKKADSKPIHASSGIYLFVLITHQII